MSVEIKGKDRDTAILLIAAAKKLGVDTREVRTTASGFVVPDEVAAEAFPEPAPVKKAAAKKTTAKKAARKTPKGKE